MRVELVFVVVEDKEPLELLFDHEIEVTVATWTSEPTLNYFNVVFLRNALKLPDDVVPHILCRVEDVTAKFGIWVVTVGK